MWKLRRATNRGLLEPWEDRTQDSKKESSWWKHPQIVLLSLSCLCCCESSTTLVPFHWSKFKWILFPNKLNSTDWTYVAMVSSICGRRRFGDAVSRRREDVFTRLFRAEFLRPCPKSSNIRSKIEQRYRFQMRKGVLQPFSPRGDEKTDASCVCRSCAGKSGDPKSGHLWPPNWD